MLDFTEEELDAVQDVLRDRFKEVVEMHLADCELQPDKDKDEIVECPAVYWRAQNCNFVMVKLPQNRFKGHFFYRPDEQFTSDQLEYADPINCVTAILRDQADYAREMQGVSSGSTGADLN